MESAKPEAAVAPRLLSIWTTNFRAASAAPSRATRRRPEPLRNEPIARRYPPVQQCAGRTAQFAFSSDRLLLHRSIGDTAPRLTALQIRRMFAQSTANTWLP